MTLMLRSEMKARGARLRFASFVPAAFSKATVVDRVRRSLLEDIGPCVCARNADFLALLIASASSCATSNSPGHFHPRYDDAYSASGQARRPLAGLGLRHYPEAD